MQVYLQKANDKIARMHRQKVDLLDQLLAIEAKSNRYVLDSAEASSYFTPALLAEEEQYYSILQPKRVKDATAPRKAPKRRKINDGARGRKGTKSKAGTTLMHYTGVHWDAQYNYRRLDR